MEAQFGHQKQPHEADREEGGMFEDQETFDELDTVPGHEAEREDSDENTRADDPHLVAEGHRRDHIVNAEA